MLTVRFGKAFGVHSSGFQRRKCDLEKPGGHVLSYRQRLGFGKRFRGERENGLAREIAFLGDEPLPQGLSWPAPEPSAIGALIERRLRQHIDLDPIRKLQERHLGRELARVDAYFLQYRRELEARGVRAGKQARFAERLAAAEEEHLRRRNDQIHPSRDFRHSASGCSPLDHRTCLADTRSLDRRSRNARGAMELRTAPAPVAAACRSGVRLDQTPVMGIVALEISRPLGAYPPVRNVVWAPQSWPRRGLALYAIAT